MRTKKQILNCSELKQELNKKRKELEGIKRKLNKSCEDQMKVYDVMKKRINRRQSFSNLKYQNQQENRANNYHQHDLTQKHFDGHLGQAKYIIQQQQMENKNRNQECIFDLNLNKQIAFAMLQESIKRQDKIKQRKLQQQKKKLQQEKKKLLQQKRQQLQKRKDQEQKKQENALNRQTVIQVNQQKAEIGGQKQNQSPINIPQISEISQLQNQNNVNINNHAPQAMQFNDEEQSNSMQDMLDLERFFQMQQVQLQESITLMNTHKSKKKTRKTEFNKIEEQEHFPSSKELDYLYSQKDLFQEEKFVDLIQDSNRMDIQSSSQEKQGEMQYFTPKLFEGQIQLECMLYRQQKKISEDILSNQLSSINQFLFENSHMIKKYQSNLQFWVILCKAIELVKSKVISNEMEGIDLIRNKVNKMKNQLQDWHKKQLQKITTMLLFQQSKIKIQPYLQRTEQAFRQIFQQIYRLPDFDKFLHNLYAGALILKTPTCVEKDKQNPLICPLCNPLAESIFKGIPLLAKNQSNLICRINSSVMDHENYPVMLPSNQVYSYNGLQQTKKIVKSSVGKFVQQYYCKFTQTWYSKQQAKKVFLA